MSFSREKRAVRTLATFLPGRFAFAFLLCILMLGISCPLMAGSSGSSSRSSTKVGTVQKGKVSWYTGYKKTASGYFNPQSMTAAHRTLPFGTIVRATDKNTGKHVDVKIDNRGPFINGRILDLTPAAFKKLAPTNRGVVSVEMKVISVPEKPVRPKW